MIDTLEATLTITGANGPRTVVFDLPRSLAQVPLKRYINFLVWCRQLVDTPNPLYVMANALSDFLEYPLIEIIEAELGEEVADPTQMFAPHVKRLDATLNKLFSYIVNVIATEKGELVDPANAGFWHNGHEYLMPTILQDALVGGRLPPLTVIEGVEVLEVQRMRQQRTQQRGDPNGALRQLLMDTANAEVSRLAEKDGRKPLLLQAAEQVAALETERRGDPNGSETFSMYCKMLAILCRRRGEKMPFDDSAREAWIIDRGLEFADVSAKNALNVDFFLASILPYSEQNPPAPGFLSRQSLAILAETRLRKPRPVKKQKAKTRKRSNASAGGG